MPIGHSGGNNIKLAVDIQVWSSKKKKKNDLRPRLETYILELSADR